MGLSPRGRWLVIIASLAVVLAVSLVGVLTAAQGNLFWLGGASSPACGGSPDGSGTPLGTSIALSTPSEQVWGHHHWYNSTVESAVPQLAWSEMGIQVVTATGSNVTPASDWAGGVLSSTGSWVAFFGFSNGTWISGGETAVESSQSLVIDSGTTGLAGVGDQLMVTFHSACLQGSISVNIP